MHAAVQVARRRAEAEEQLARAAERELAALQRQEQAAKALRECPENAGSNKAEGAPPQRTTGQCTSWAGVWAVVSGLFTC